MIILIDEFMKKVFFILTLILLITSCAAEPQEDLSQTTYALGTIITINLYDQGNQDLMDDLIARVSEIEKLMSAQLDDSEVSLITAQAGIAPVVVSDETFQVVERALHYADLSGGSFDPTIGPVVDLWGVGTDEAHVPSQDEIDSALKLVAYSKVVLDKEQQTVYLEEKGMSLDLGGIAKGYVADALVEMLHETSVARAMINLGGNIYAYGEKRDGSPYKVAVQTPYDTRNTYFGYVEVQDKTVVTSGPYERYFEASGQIYHHIFDARTGYPTEGDVVSVSIIAENSMDADALSTMLFTMTPEAGIALIESMEGVGCIYVDEEYGLSLSSDIKDIFTLTDETYKIQ